MLRRLTLALLTVCLAFPAVATPLCHDTSPAAVTAEHGSQHASDHVGTMAAAGYRLAITGHEAPAPHHPPEQTAAKHQCIGCIAPVRAMAMPVVVTLPPVAPQSPVIEPLGDLALSPALPPPRP